jgi:hypothetical protein
VGPVVDEGPYDDLGASFGRVAERDLRTAAGDVLAQHRRQAVGLAPAGVPVAADAEEAEVEQAHGAGGGPGPGQAAAGEVQCDLGAQFGQGTGDLPHVFVQGLLLLGAELFVVEALAAACVVGADGLEVTARPRADPHVPPGGRDDQGPDAGEMLGVLQRRPVWSR